MFWWSCCVVMWRHLSVTFWTSLRLITNAQLAFSSFNIKYCIILSEAIRKHFAHHLLSIWQPTVQHGKSRYWTRKSDNDHSSWLLSSQYKPVGVCLSVPLLVLIILLLQWTYGRTPQCKRSINIMLHVGLSKRITLDSVRACMPTRPCSVGKLWNATTVL